MVPVGDQFAHPGAVGLGVIVAADGARGEERVDCGLVHGEPRADIAEDGLELLRHDGQRGVEDHRRQVHKRRGRSETAGFASSNQGHVSNVASVTRGLSSRAWWSQVSWSQSYEWRPAVPV